MALQTERLDILTAAADQREREVMQYQINIDNYVLAIAEIDQNHCLDPALLEFRDRLRGLLESSKTEQKKEQIMLKVIKSQLGAA